VKDLHSRRDTYTALQSSHRARTAMGAPARRCKGGSTPLDMSNSSECKSTADGRAWNSEVVGAAPTTQTIFCSLAQKSVHSADNRKVCERYAGEQPIRGCTWCEVSLPTTPLVGSTPTFRSSIASPSDTGSGLLNPRLRVRIAPRLPLHPRRSERMATS